MEFEFEFQVETGRHPEHLLTEKSSGDGAEVGRAVVHGCRGDAEATLGARHAGDAWAPRRDAVLVLPAFEQKQTEACVIF